MLNRVVKYCEAEGITIAEFERRCGLGNGTVGRWKDGGGPNYNTLVKIVEKTDTEIGFWLKED